MTWTKLETCAVFAVIFLFATVSARGSKGHGDECILGLSASIGAGNEADTCKDDQNLVCLGDKCQCNPAGYVYQSGFAGISFLGGGCKIRANLPCKSDGTACVSNSVCDSICRCNEGYHMTLAGDCTNGAFKIAGTTLPVFLLGMLFCYFKF